MRDSIGTTSKPDRRELIAVLLIVVFATALRLYGLGARPLLWEDELGLREYSLTGRATWMFSEAPLYSWLQFIWMWWAQGSDAITMRLVSIGFGVLGVIAAWGLGRTIGGVAAGLLTASLLSISPMALSLSHEVRPYSLFILTSVLLLGSFLWAWDRNGRRAWLGYGLALTAALFTHLLAVQICIALGVTAVVMVWVERRRPQIRTRLVTFAAVSLGFGLLGVSWLRFRPSQEYLVSGPYGRGVSEFVVAVIKSLGGVADGHTPLAVALAVLAGMGSVALARKRAMPGLLLSTVIVMGCLVTYVTGELVSDWTWLAWQRYLTHLLIPYLVLIALGTLWFARAARERASGASATALMAAIALLPILLGAPGTLSWLKSPDRHPDLATVSRYTHFASIHEHEVIGLILVEILGLRARGLSMGFVRRRYAYDQVRLDSLPTYSLGGRGVQEIVERPSRGHVATVLEPAAMSSPPPDGKYAVFPPMVGCEGLTRRPIQGVKESATERREKWGLICRVRFER